jgi:F0F1-type ATP synthase membrane subunit b/b'
LSCALLYYQFYKPKNKVDSKEFSSCRNEDLKKNYEDNKYLKIGQLIKIRWANRLSSIVLGLALLIIMKMGSNNKNFKDALIPALFIFFAIIVLVVLNNIISSKIEKDLEAFDKEIASNLQKVNESSKEEFTLFNQLMLERGRLEKSTYINFFKDSVSGEDSGKSMLQNLVLFFASIFKNIGLAFTNLIIPSSKDNTADKKINENLEIYNGLKAGTNLALKEVENTIKDLNKNSGLLKKNSIHNTFFKIADSLCIQESFGRVFD